MSAPPIQGADGSSLSHDDFAHLTAFEWNALRRLADISGMTTVAAMLSATSPVQQRNAVQDLVTHELAELTRRSSTPSVPTKNDVVKLDVSSYSGEGAKRLALNRWLCEVDIAVQARQLSTEFARTHFLLSKLSGKAKEWALGKLVAAPGCFPDMASLKDDLRLAFEPPQDENQHRSAFLALKQGRSSMLDYIQRVRHLSSCIVTNPIDMVTQVHVFVSGMNAGHQRFYLTRKPPASLEDAFAVALREDFSVMASQAHQRSFHRTVSEPEPMEIDAIVRATPPRHGASAGQSRPASSKQLVCFRCRKIGHRAAECRARAPVLAAVESGDIVVRSAQPKNDDNHPAAIHAQLNATTPSNDKRLIVLSVHVGGATRPLRALLDSGATNNFVRADSLKVLPSRLRVREHSGEMVVKYADGKPRTLQQRSVVVPYEFDGFASSDEFLVIDLSGSFDCIFGMPWLARHRPDIDWLNRTVQPRDIDVNAVLAFLAGSASTWPHVAVVDPDSTICTRHEASDGPSYTVCNTATYTPSAEEWFLNQETAPKQRLSVCHGRAAASMDLEPTLAQRRPVPSKTEVEQRSPLSCVGVDEQWLPRPAVGALSSPSVPQRRRERRARSRSPQQAWPAAPVPVFDITSVVNLTGVGPLSHSLKVTSPPRDATGITQLQEKPWDEMLRDLKGGEIEQMCLVAQESELDSHERPAGMEPKSVREERFAVQSWEALAASKNPALALVREFADIFPDKIPPVLPTDRGVRHEIDLAPGSKYCVTRQWPLPRDQVEAIDAFFEGRRQAGHVRESTSPHSSPTFCVKKATGEWHIVHAFNKMNDATIPAQTPIPRKDMVLDTMSSSTIFSSLDLTDGFYQILMRSQDAPLTAVSTPSGMLWEWLVMPQGLKNAPATFNRMVSHVLRPFRDFAPSYFDDIFVHSRAADGAPDLEVHLGHLRKVFESMRENKLYANLKKCIFCVPEIPVLGSYVSAKGVRADPEKIASICSWPEPKGQKQLRQWLGLANYLHHYAKDFAAVIHPLSQLLKKDATWAWRQEHQDAFDEIKKRLSSAPVLALPDHTKPFHVVCDTSDFAIGCALMQHDDGGCERVVSYQSRQLKPAERNYPVHDKELLAMRYALVKFRVYLLGEQSFVLYTDHASLRTATKTPHLSQRMARWLSFFAEYNFVVFYKPGSTNIIADALSRRPDYDPRADIPAHAALDDDDDVCAACVSLGINTTAVTAVNPLRVDIASAYLRDEFYLPIIRYCRDPSDEALRKLTASTRAQLSRYAMDGDLLMYQVDCFDSPRIVVPLDDDLRARILHEYHDSASGGHFGREKTYLALSRDFYWPHMYKWVRKWVRSCETCQRVKPTPSSQAPLRPLPIATEAWRSVSMDFVFGLPADVLGRTGILVVVDRFSKMVHLAPVAASITVEDTAALFIDMIFKHHGMPTTIASDRDPRFTAAFWLRLFELLGTRLMMSTAAHPETDGQTERANRVLEDVLRSYATSYTSWSAFLPMTEFAMNNAVHASTGLTPLFVNSARHPRAPVLLGLANGSALGGGETPGALVSNTAAATGAAATGDHVLRNNDANVSVSEMVLDPETLQATESTVTPVSNEHTSVNVAKTRAVTRHEKKPLSVQEASRWASESLINPTRRALQFKPTLDTSPNTAPAATAEPPSARLVSSAAIDEFVQQRHSVARFVRDAIASAVDKQKAFADQRGRKNHEKFAVGDRVLLSTSGIQAASVTNLGANKLAPRFIGPFKITKVIGDAYTLDIPAAMRLHPTFYVGRLKRYWPALIPPDQQDESQRAHTAVLDAAVPSAGLVDADHEVLRCRFEEPRSTAPSAPSVSATRPTTPSSARQVPLQAPPVPLPHSRRSRQSQHDDRSREAPPQAAQQQQAPGVSPPAPRTHFHRYGPPPLVDSAGHQRWIVERLLGHRDLSPRGRRDVARHRDQEQSIPSTREYRVRWLGFPPTSDTWEPRTTLQLDVPDLVNAYENAYEGACAGENAREPANASEIVNYVESNSRDRVRETMSARSNSDSA